MSLYTFFLRPLLFKIDPENIHDRALRLGKFLGKFSLVRSLLRFFFVYQHPSLEVTIKNLQFSNPLGLAAGFDKNGILLEILPCIGFGFIEIGSVTAQPCSGNPKPRIWRLPKDKALAVHYGLCNDGASALNNRLQQQHCSLPLGINIAKTNDSSIKGAASVHDYVTSYTLLKDFGGYMVLNISCPNTGDGRSFQDPVLLEHLLRNIGKPEKIILLKISPDINKKNLDKIILLAKKYHLAGFVLTNLTHSHEGLTTDATFLKQIKGGISGKPAKEKSDELIKYVYKKTHGTMLIIGVGGVFTARDAYDKIRAGATLVGLVTGMIYEGPGICKKINKGLVHLLQQDGFQSIQDAVGVDAREK